jgi:choloylglycine hydrolase
VRIASEVKLHYLVNDQAGNTATIEFLNGKLVAHSGETLPVSALTNDTYAKSLNYSKTTAAEKAGTRRSLDRFVRAAQKTAAFDKQEKVGTEAVNYAFEILNSVAQEGATQWSIVYDQKRGRIYFRTLQNPEIRMIDTRSFDYSCGSVVKTLDVSSKEGGDATSRFVDYTRKANRDLIERSFAGTDFLRGAPAAVKDQLASYPEQFTCNAKQETVSSAKVLVLRQSLACFLPILIMFFT